MIEEIKKEIKNTAIRFDSSYACKIKHDDKVILIERVFAILDKYNNQKNVSKETQDILLSNFHKEHTRATKYQSAWEELREDNQLPILFIELLSELMQELEQKYNLDVSIVERVDE